MLKIRSSQAATILPAGKGSALSVGAQSYIKDLYLQDVFNTSKEFYSKETEKGTLMEEEAIEYLMDHSDLGFMTKNEEHFENDYIKGTPDVILSDRVVDIKCPWDCFTFKAFFKDFKPPQIYIVQLQCYMELVGVDQATLAYVLMNTPTHLDPDGLDYSLFPPEKRIRLFHFQRDEALIEKLYSKVKSSQDFYQFLKATQS